MRILTILFFLGLSSTSLQANTEQNKTIVKRFWDMAFNKHRPVEAAKMYLAEEYIQHNPQVASGREAFISAFKNFYQDKINLTMTSEIKRVIAEDDLVVLHIKKKNDSDDRGTAGVDIFGVKDGKIIEHWDVNQKIPEMMAHQNTMF